SRLIQAAAMEQTQLIELGNRRKEVEAELARYQQLGLSAAEKESAVRKANLELSKADAANLEAKESRLTSQATGFGALKPWERSRALAVARGAQGRSWDQLSPFEKDQLSRVAPGWAGKQQELAGEASPEYRELQRMGLIESGTLGETRAQLQK